MINNTFEIYSWAVYLKVGTIFQMFGMQCSRRDQLTMDLTFTEILIEIFVK